MTAGKLLLPAADEHNELHPSPRPWSPPVKPNGPAPAAAESSHPRSSKTRKRPRTSSSSSSSPSQASVLASKSAAVPPQPPHSNKYSRGGIEAAAGELGATRPLDNTAPARPSNKTSRTAQLSGLHSSRGSDDSSGGSSGGVDAGVQLSKSAKLLEEDRKKVASIRSFLLNFLEERDCSIKKRLVSARG